MQVKKKSLISLDIGTHSIKVIEVLPGGASPFVKNVGIRELPAGPTEENLPKALKSLLEANNITTKEASISISGSNIVVRFVELPLMQDSEISQALPYEAEKHIPFDVKEMILDYAILERNEADKKLKTLLVGAKKNLVERRVKVLADMGLVLNVVDVDSFAIFNAFIKGVPKDKRNGDKIIALLNIGANLTNVVVTSGNILSMVRDINLGGANLTKALQEQLGIDLGEAEALKQNPGAKEKEVFAVIKGTLQKLTDEIRLSFTYYENQYGKGVDEVYISGGTTRLSGLIPFLEEYLGVGCKEWDPLRPLDIDPKISRKVLDKLRPSLAVCSGLALRK